jgi:integrase
LASLRPFVRWCLKERRLGSDPLHTLEKANEKLDVRRDRRALTPEQATHSLSATQQRSLQELLTVRRGKNRGKLLAKVKPAARLEALEAGRQRALIYLTVMQTGLRRKEIKLTTWMDIHLDAGTQPFLSLRPVTTKASRDETIPLKQGLADALLAWRTGNPAAKPTDRVFDRIPGVETLKKDLEAAGIAYEDASGRVVDFHALRHTFGTLLSRSGVMPRAAQALMRHSSLDLTMNTYTDPRLLDLTGAVEKLPDLYLESESQELKATGTDGEIPEGALAPVADFSRPGGGKC